MKNIREQMEEKNSKNKYKKGRFNIEVKPRNDEIFLRDNVQEVPDLIDLNLEPARNIHSDTPDLIDLNPEPTPISLNNEISHSTAMNRARRIKEEKNKKTKERTFDEF